MALMEAKETATTEELAHFLKVSEMTVRARSGLLPARGQAPALPRRGSAGAKDGRRGGLRTEDGQGYGGQAQAGGHRGLACQARNDRIP